MNQIRQKHGLRWVKAAGLAGLMILAWSAPAEDIVATQNQIFRGKVKSANTNGIVIEVRKQGVQRVITVPRSLIIRVTVAPPPSIVRGIKAYEDGKIKEAQLNLGKGILKYQGLDVEWASKGMIYFARASLAAGNYAKAEKAFTLFMSSYPNHPLLQDARIGLAEIEVMKNNYETALPELHKLAESYDKQMKLSKSQMPYAAAVYMGIGKCLEGQLKPAEALDAYMRVVALYPAEKYYPEALYRSALLYADSARPEKAEPLLSELINDYPSSEFAPKAIAKKKALRVRRGTAGSISGSP